MDRALQFYRLLQAYEELTRLETFALKENNLAYLTRLQARKRPLAAKLAPMRREADFPESESRRVDGRLRALQTTEKANLEVLELAMKSVSESLADLGRTHSRCSRLHRTYGRAVPAGVGTLAGQA
ncbi:MAG: hypothetical protein R3F07_15235 [Opitutaceae bacterium]